MRQRAMIFLLNHGLDDVVMNPKKCGFSGMVGCVSRLKRVQKVIRRDMMSETLFDHSFVDSGMKFEYFVGKEIGKHGRGEI